MDFRCFRLGYRRTRCLSFALRRAGFTLIELMVVISIAAILIALGTVSYTTAQRKSRDARRQGDMRAIQNGFEQYYADLVNGSSYGASCAAMAVAPYIPGGLPVDPKPSQTYSCTSTASTYCACALLESGVGNSDDASCTFDSSGDESYFCVVNLQ